MTTDHNVELIRRHQSRLKKLELQAASKGADTPPEILTEIEDIQAVLRALTTVADLPGDDNRLNVMVATVTEVSNVKAELKSDINAIKDQLNDAQEYARLFQELVSNSTQAFNYRILADLKILTYAIVSLAVLMLVGFILIGG